VFSSTRRGDEIPGGHGHDYHPPKWRQGQGRGTGLQAPAIDCDDGVSGGQRIRSRVQECLERRLCASRRGHRGGVLRLDRRPELDGQRDEGAGHPQFFQNRAEWWQHGFLLTRFRENSVDHRYPTGVARSGMNSVSG
jgi:hypothetical protein